MKAFLKSMDERVWVSIDEGWTISSTSIASVVTPIDISTWIMDDLAKCN